MKIYRSIELGADELSQKIGTADDVKIQFDPLDESDLVQSDFDLIELSEEKTQSILSKMNMLDWQIQSTGAADAFIVDHKKLKPIHLSSVAFVNFLQSKHITIDTAKNAVLVGSYSFLITYGVALAKIGFNKIYLISPDHISHKEKIAETQKYLFNVQIHQLQLDDMAGISDLASLLVIDFDLNQFPELVETLTYFNFVTENAVFCDLQSYRNEALSSEAEKASLRVLDSAEFHLHKYRLFQKNLNNRS